MNHEDWVDTDNRRVRAKLKNDLEEVFQTMYKKLERQSSSISLRGGSYEYENLYKRRKIFVGGDEKTEYVFTCLVRNRVLKQFKEYFVSAEYNVNSVPTPQLAIAGRFIFEYDDQRRLVLYGMAEECALPNVWDSNPYRREEAYFTKKTPSSEVGEYRMDCFRFVRSFLDR